MVAQSTDNSRVDAIKLVYDLFKHLTALSSASTLAVLGILRLLDQPPQLFWLLIVGAIVAVVCCGGSIWSMMGIAAQLRNPEEGSKLLDFCIF